MSKWLPKRLLMVGKAGGGERRSGGHKPVGEPLAADGRMNSHAEGGGGAMGLAPNRAWSACAMRPGLQAHLSFFSTSDGAVVWAKGIPTSRRQIPPSGRNQLSGALIRGASARSPRMAVVAVVLFPTTVSHALEPLWHLRSSGSTPTVVGLAPTGRASGRACHVAQTPPNPLGLWPQ